MYKTMYYIFALSLFLLSVPLLNIPPAAAASADNEIIYLTDSAVSGDGKTYLYQVDLNDIDNRADLTLLEELTYEQVDAMAASADGSKIYLIDKVTSKIGVYDVDADTFTDTLTVIKDGGVRVPDIVLATFSPAGDLFVASDSTDKVYTVDPVTGIATSLGMVNNSGVSVNISGADLAFLSDGTLYLWANQSKSGAPHGLYKITDPYIALNATYIGAGDGDFFTGLAVRDNGAGDLVGSETTNNSIKVIVKDTANMPTVYPMYLDGSPYAYAYGDMTAGPIINPLEISKTAVTSYNRYWDWTINKTSDQTDLSLNIAEDYTVNYQVAFNSAYNDKDWMVTGEIDIHNPNIIPAIITNVSDIVSSDIAMNVDCGDISFPYELAPDTDLVCTYAGALPDGSERLNTATVETDDNGSVLGATATAAVVFGEPSDIIDESIEVNDSLMGLLGTVDAANASTTFNYSYPIVYAECGQHALDNIADFITNDTQTSGSSSWSISVNIPCNDGCTLTQGYWKTHSQAGPAAHPDEAWDLIGGSDTDFFSSGQSYLEVLNTAPKKGNAYYILAHQYIAAELNMLNGAFVPSEVQEAFDAATELFNNNTPDDVINLKGQDKQPWLDAASVLGDYNEGLIGPGHCSENAYTLVDTLEVNAANINGTDSNIALTSGNMYQINITGSWVNHNGRMVDAEYISDDGWVTYADGPAIGLNQLDTQVNDTFVNWGSYAGDHAYSLMMPGNDAPFKFRVFDGDPNTNTPNPNWYGDNSGSLTVTIYAVN